MTEELEDAFQFVVKYEPFWAAHNNIIRLDERIRRTPLGDPCMERLLYAEACACQLAEGDLVHLEDLVLLDGRSYTGAPSIALSSAMSILKHWRRARGADPMTLLRTHRPGQYDRQAGQSTDNASSATECVDDEGAVSPAHLEAWHSAVARSTRYPALMAAAIAWDKWLTLLPDPRGAWWASLLASLVLKARGLTPHLLLPIDTGRRHATYRRHPKHDLKTRIAGFMSWAEAAATQTNKEIDKLTLAEGLLRTRLKGKRRHSRLPALVDLLLTRPLVSVPMAARALQCTPRAVEKMLPLLGSLPREVTGRRRYRVWSIA